MIRGDLKIYLPILGAVAATNIALWLLSILLMFFSKDKDAALFDVARNWPKSGVYKAGFCLFIGLTSAHVLPVVIGLIRAV